MSLSASLLYPSPFLGAVAHPEALRAEIPGILTRAASLWLHLAGDASASPWAAPQPCHSRSDPSPAEGCAPAPARAAKVSALIRDSGRLFPNLSSLSCWCDAAFEIINPLGAGLCCRMHQLVPRLQQQSLNYLGFFLLFAEFSLVLPWMREKLLQS